MTTDVDLSQIMNDRLDDLEQSGRAIGTVDPSDGAVVKDSFDVSRVVLTTEQKLSIKDKIREVAPDKEVDLARIIAEVTGVAVEKFRGQSLYLTDLR